MQHLRRPPARALLVGPLAAGLLLWAAPRPVPTDPPAPAVAAAAALETWDELAADYAAALADWEARYEAAEDVRERRALREEHPARGFWDRFDALAPRDGRACLWQVENAGLAGYRGRDGRGVKATAYERAFALEGAADADWTGPLLERLARDRTAVGDEAFERYLERVIEATSTPVLRAQALFVLGDWLASSDDDERAGRGLELLKRAAAIEGTPWAEQAAGRVYELENLVIGATAPDFAGELAGGGTWRLSAQRGKVVVLDFFGFW
jgi:hypothetical protein